MELYIYIILPAMALSHPHPFHFPLSHLPAQLSLLPARASEQGNVIGSVRICICYSTGRSDIQDIFHEL